MAGPLVVFVARSSSPRGPVETQKQWLREKLIPTKAAYEAEWGAKEHAEDIVIVRKANSAIRRDTANELAAVMQRCQTEGRALEIVMNGYDGLSVNFCSISQVFSPFMSLDITWMAWVDRPRKFVWCRLADLLRQIHGADEHGNDDFEVPDSAEHIASILEQLALHRARLSEATVDLHELSQTRNKPPESYRCEACQYWTSSLPSWYMHLKRCRGKQKYVPMVVTLPDGGIPVGEVLIYDDLSSRPDDLPTYDEVPANPTSSESFCRAPGCKHKRRLQTPADMRGYIRKCCPQYLPSPLQRLNLEDHDRPLHILGLVQRQWMRRHPPEPIPRISRPPSPSMEDQMVEVSCPFRYAILDGEILVRYDEPGPDDQPMIDLFSFRR